MFRTTTIALALMAPTLAQATECYVRTAMSAQASASISRVADVQPLVVPISATQNKCFVTYRALINDQWHTLEGESVGPKSLSEQELCATAMDRSRAQILSRANPTNMSVETKMVCDERPQVKVKNVKVGDMVRESEVRPHPNFPKPFTYRTAQCRWFIEPELGQHDLLQRQGIICRSHGDTWRVIDKW